MFNNTIDLLRLLRQQEQIT